MQRIALIILLVVVLVACSGSNSPVTDGTEVPAETEIVAETDPPATVLAPTPPPPATEAPPETDAPPTTAVSSGTTSDTAVTGVASPGAPTGLTATPDGTSANLSWTAPADGGGSAIMDYVVEYRQTPNTTVTVDADVGDTSMTALGGTTGRYQWEELIVQAYDLDDVAAQAIISTVWNDNGVGVNGGRWDTQIDWSYEVNAPTGASETLDITMPYPSTAITIWSAMMDPGEGDNPGSFTGGDGDETGYATCYDVNDTVVGEMRLHPSTADGPNEGTGRYPFTPTLTGPCSRIRVESLPWQNAAGDVYADEDDGQTYDNEPTIVSNNTDLMVGAVEWNPAGAGGAGGWATLADGTTAATSAVVPGLSAGRAYEFRVSVTNSVGTGAASSSVYLLLNVDVAIIPATSSTTSDTAAVTATAEIAVTAATSSTSSI